MDQKKNFGETKRNVSVHCNEYNKPSKKSKPAAEKILTIFEDFM